jgi:D-tyrosyl-tRNA(Tyr) deacylase
VRISPQTVGAERIVDDTQTDSDTLVKKILNAKLFEDAGEAWGSWKRSVKDIDGEVLCG